MEPEAQFKIDELAEATDLSRRTIHHYIAEGLIPRARGGAGPAAYYDEEHYLRLRILTRLKGMGLSLSTIRDSLNDLSLEEMREVLELPEDLDYRAIWSHVAMKRSGTPESFRVEEAELHESQDEMLWSGPAPTASPSSWRMKLARRARHAMPSEPPAEADLRQDVFDEFSPMSAIRRDPEFVDRLADEGRHEVEESAPRRIDHRMEDFERLEDKHHAAYMMSPTSFPDGATDLFAGTDPDAGADPRNEPLHPEMDSQPWRRVRVSSDLEISYRPSADPLTRKKLRHLLDFVHRLFRLERSSEGLTPDVLTPDELTPDGQNPDGLTPEGFIAETRPAGRRAPGHGSKSMDSSRTRGKRPQEEET